MAFKLETTLENRVKGEYWKLVRIICDLKRVKMMARLELYVDAQAASATEYVGSIDSRSYEFPFDEALMTRAQMYTKIKKNIEEFNKAEDV